MVPRASRSSWSVLPWSTQGRCCRSLRASRFLPRFDPVFQDSRIHPFLDQANDPAVTDPGVEIATGDPTSLLSDADQAFADAETALQDGDLGLYQEKIEEARNLIADALEILVNQPCRRSLGAGSAEAFGQLGEIGAELDLVPGLEIDTRIRTLGDHEFDVRLHVAMFEL